MSDGLDSTCSFARASSTFMPSIDFVRNTRAAFARIVAEKQRAKFMPGIITLSSSWPACAPSITAVSFPITW